MTNFGIFEIAITKTTESIREKSPIMRMYGIAPERLGKDVEALVVPLFVPACMWISAS